MNETNSAHEPPWDELKRIQEAVADEGPRDPDARRAIDDAYSVIVNELQEHTPDSLRRRYSSLVSNRRRKYRDRRATDEFLARSCPEADDTADPVAVLAKREVAALVLAAVGPEDRVHLWNAAVGHSYEDIAAAANDPPGTIKARISRVRSRLRHSLRELALSA